MKTVITQVFFYYFKHHGKLAIWHWWFYICPFTLISFFYQKVFDFVYWTILILTFVFLFKKKKISWQTTHLKIILIFTSHHTNLFYFIFFKKTSFKTKQVNKHNHHILISKLSVNIIKNKVDHVPIYHSLSLL